MHMVEQSHGGDEKTNTMHVSCRVYTMVIGTKEQVIRHEVREESSGEGTSSRGAWQRLGAFLGVGWGAVGRFELSSV